MASGDQVWQPQTVQGDQFFLLQMVQGDHLKYDSPLDDFHHTIAVVLLCTLNIMTMVGKRSSIKEVRD